MALVALVAVHRAETSTPLYALLEKFWQISVYMTDDAIAKLSVDDKFSQINGKSSEI